MTQLIHLIAVSQNVIFQFKVTYNDVYIYHERRKVEVVKVSYTLIIKKLS